MQIHTDLCPMVIFPHYTHSCTADIIIAIRIKSEPSWENLTQAGTTFGSIVGYIVGPNDGISSGEQLVWFKMLYTNTSNSGNASNAFVEAYNLTQSWSVQEPHGIQGGKTGCLLNAYFTDNDTAQYLSYYTNYLETSQGRFPAKQLLMYISSP